jgi:uncharacterized membrane protein
MKKLFITGLISLLPTALTFILLMWVINVLTHPFLDTTVNYFCNYGITPPDCLLETTPYYLTLGLKLLILISLFISCLFIGRIANWYIFKKTLLAGTRILDKIPLVSSIYHSSNQVIDTMVQPDAETFTKVVSIPFPSSVSRSIGLVSDSAVVNELNKELVAVFVPATPNPLMGFLVFLPNEMIHHLDTPVDEAIKIIASCGAVGSLSEIR